MTTYDECFVCGENTHDPQDHEALTILQPSLHRIDEFTQILVGEAESYGVSQDKIQEWERDLDADPNDEFRAEWVDDIIREVQEAIEDKGYYVVTDFDCWNVYAPITS